MPARKPAARAGPKKLSLDNGYYSGKNLQEVSDRQVETYIATDRGEKAWRRAGATFVEADFRYDEERDGFHSCGEKCVRSSRREWPGCKKGWTRGDEVKNRP